MRGGKRPRGGPRGGGRSGGPMFKKRKMSKKFWQQRKTAVMAPAPVEDEKSETSSESETEVEPNTYETLLGVFGKTDQSQNVAIESESENESLGEEEEASEGSKQSDDPENQGDSKSDNSDKSDAEEQSEKENDDQEESDIGEEIIAENDEDSDDQAEVETESEQDPFVAKHELEIAKSLQEKLSEKSFVQDTTVWPALGRLVIQHPKWRHSKAGSPVKSKKSKKALLDDEEDDAADNAPLAESQGKLVNLNLTSPKSSLADLFVKKQLLDNAGTFTPLQSEVFSLLSSYKDIFLNERTHENGEEIRQAYTLHVLNHMLKTRSKILKNNEKLAKAKNNKETLAMSVRDQGLCRPKIVIVVPFKESARRIISMMTKLLFKEVKGGNVANKKRFDQDFGDEEQVREKRNKPDDYYDMFAGNIDDGFKIGIAVTKKTLKLYADFYSSDIIIASPLGLRLVIGVEGEAKRDHDFLASIEMLILDQTDVFTMQNWDHVSGLFESLHQQPAKSHGVDFSRVRLWTLNGLSRLYRQTILISSIPMPEINSLLSKHCQNYCGTVRTANSFSKGAVSAIASKVPIVFHRYETDSVAKSPEDRFQYFTSKILPDFKKDMMYHTLILVPSYFDYVRVRNHFNATDLDFAEICEYTKDKKIAMARDLFYHSEKHFLLYTERAHFFRRFMIKGIRHLIFYQPPQYPRFFSEMCNLLQDCFQNKKGGSEGNMSCTVLYSKYDVAARVAPIVTTERAKVMLSSDKNIHMFVPGS